MKTVVATLFLILGIPMAAHLSFQDQDTRPEKQDPIPVPEEGAVERRDFMRTKLMYTQNILEGLTIGEFELIDRGISELEGILDANNG